MDFIIYIFIIFIAVVFIISVSNHMSDKLVDEIKDQFIKNGLNELRTQLRELLRLTRENKADIDALHKRIMILCNKMVD